jgi:hypothetical protein
VSRTAFVRTAKDHLQVFSSKALSFGSCLSRDFHSGQAAHLLSASAALEEGEPVPYDRHLDEKLLGGRIADLVREREAQSHKVSPIRCSAQSASHRNMIETLRHDNWRLTARLMKPKWAPVRPGQMNRPTAKFAVKNLSNR